MTQLFELRLRTVKTILITLSAIAAAALVSAVPPSAPSLAEVIKRSEVVAIVSVTNVSEQVIGKGEQQVHKQRADATIERLFKGNASQILRLAFDASDMKSSCRPPLLHAGRFLVFLRREGEFYVRTDAWYSQATITTNRVNWFMAQPMDLQAAIREVESIVQKQ